MHNSVNILKINEVYTLNGLLCGIISYISIKLLTSNITFGYKFKGNEVSISWYLYPHAHYSIHLCQTWKELNCSSTNKLIKKMWYIQCSTVQLWEGRKSATCNNMDGPQQHYAKWGKSERDKYHTISLLSGI